MKIVENSLDNFMQAQFFFENMTRNAMKEYKIAGGCKSVIIALTDKRKSNGERMVVKHDLLPAYEKEGDEFSSMNMVNNLSKLKFLLEIKSKDLNIFAMYEQHLVKRPDKRDMILVIFSYIGATIKRTFDAEWKNIYEDTDGFHVDVDFIETTDTHEN